MLIGELAERAGTSARALRYYEAQGLLSPGRDANGYRRYGEDDLVTVRQIRALLDAGFGSTSIAALLPCARGSEPTIELCPEVAAEMRRTLSGIDAELDTLRRHRRAVRGLLTSG